MTDDTIDRKLAESEQLRCYCPSDCNCRNTGPPFFRRNICGCKRHTDNER